VPRHIEVQICEAGDIQIDAANFEVPPISQEGKWAGYEALVNIYLRALDVSLTIAMINKSKEPFVS
jgi:hypothetical protein